MYNNEIHNPLVSVLVICYNHYKFIKECIQSILYQTYSDIELVVVDNSDNDKSKLIVEELLQSNSFEYIKQENIGLPRTLNKYIPLLRGKYCIFISADDYMLKDRIEKQVNFMESNPEYVMGYGNTIAVNELSDQIGIVKSNKYVSGYIFEKLIRFKFHPPAPSYIYSKSIFDKVGLYDENVKYLEDRYMNFKIARNHQIGYQNESISYHRQHSKNLTRTVSMKLQIKDVYYILDQYKYLPKFRSIRHDANLYLYCILSGTNLQLGYLYMFLATPRFFSLDYIKSTIRLIRNTMSSLFALSNNKQTK